MTSPAPQSPADALQPPPAPDTPADRLRAALRVLWWSYGTLARVLRLSPSTTRNWGLGRAPVPPEVLAWLERLARCHEGEGPGR